MERSGSTRPHPPSLADYLPPEHRFLSKREGGVWDYKVYAPISLDDSPSIKVVVRYGTHEADSMPTATFLLLVEKGLFVKVMS